MTDRDNFAAAALAGLLVNANSDIDEDTLDTPSDIAYTAYQMADAMLRERGNHIPDAGKMAETPKETQDCPTDQERFNSAVMNWISEATSVWAEACRSDGGRKIMRDACMSCWDAYCPTNHDAAPAARASEATASPERVRVRGDAGTGDTQEPVAWAVVYPNDEVAVVAFKRRDADERATASDRVVPLYRQPQPTLTDAEREAIADAADRYAALTPESSETVATLRGLLERTGGER